MTESLAVVVPTFRRPDGLRLAIASLFEQDVDQDFDLLVVDNDPQNSAAPVCAELQANAPRNIHFRHVHEPNAGVANARNKALEETTAPLIAFLDDDQTAPPQWLSTMLACHTQYPAAVTFGPVETVLPDSVSEHKTYLSDFFARHFDAETGYIKEYFGCGNSLLNLDLIPPQRPVFDARMNETGGEDDLLFSRIWHSKGKFAWCKEGFVYEHVPESRATLKYTLKRAVAYGQGPITEALARRPARIDLAFFWMIVGLVKGGLNLVIYAAKFVLRSENRAFNLDKAMRGFGKLYFWKKHRFYGASRL